MKKMNRKAIALIIMIAVLLTATVGGTMAYLAAATSSVVNTFEPANVPPEINEEREGNVKKNVTVTNSGNVDAYIRAKIVVTWQDGQGNVYPKMPVVGTDYTMSTGIGNGWKLESDGYYYYSGEVAPNTPTNALIITCEPKNTAPTDAYNLHVEILAQAIQADGLGADITTAQAAFAAAANKN